MKTLITCLGECLIDFLPLKGGAATDLRMYAGGSPLNIAIGIARLGQPIAFACKIATDYFGHYLQHYMQDNGIDTRFLTQVEGHSTLAFAIIEDGQAHYSFYGEGTADSLMTPEDIPAALFEETAILHVGSVSLLRGTTPETVLSTFAQLKGRALLSIDPNVRLHLVHDEQAYRALLRRFFQLTDVLKLSDTELAWFLPELPFTEAIQALLDLGPSLVIVTRGAEGAVAARKDKELLSVAGYAVEVVDTIGAGDAFCAGVLAQLAERNIVAREALEALSDADLCAILDFAAGAAALNCTREGANPPERAEVEQFVGPWRGTRTVASEAGISPAL